MPFLSESAEAWLDRLVEEHISTHPFDWWTATLTRRCAYEIKHAQSRQASLHASGKRKPKRNRALTRFVKLQWIRLEREGIQEHLRASKINSVNKREIVKLQDLRSRRERWRYGPDGEKPITIKTIREIIRDEDLKKANS